MVNMHKNNWKPDTCGCKIEFEFDRDLPADQRVHTGTKVIKNCPEHTETRPATLYNTLIDENRRKNQTLTEVKKEFPDLEETYTDPITGEPNKIRMKWGNKIDWSFSGTETNRILEVEVKGRATTPQEKSRLRTRLDTKFGTGKVIVR